MTRPVLHRAQPLTEQDKRAQFDVEKGIPVPRSASGWVKYPFRQMEVGDSFFVAGATSKTLVNAAQGHRYEGRKYTVRTVDGGARVWRIA